MALASRFEDLRAWQAARALTRTIYALVCRGDFARDFALKDQICRAAISTMNNIAEGFDSASHVEFSRFLRYASRSASEVQSCLHIARDQNYIDRVQFEVAYSEAAVVRKLCTALVRSLTRPRVPSREPVVRESASPAYGTPRSVRRCRGRTVASETVISRADNAPVTGHRSPVPPFWSEK